MNHRCNQFFLNIKLNRGSLVSNINAFLNFNSGDDFIMLKNALKSHPQFDMCSLVANTCDEFLLSQPIGFSNNLNKNLYWFSTILCDYEKELNLFLELKDKFEHAVLYNDYENALTILHQIDESITTSMWGLKSKVLVESLLGKSKTELLNNGDYKDNAKVFLQLFYDYVDENTNIENYIKMLRSNCEELTNGLDDFIMYYFCNEINKNEESLNNVAKYISTLPIIDIYLYMKDLIHMFIYTKNENKYIKLSLSNLQNIDDTEIKTYNSLLEEKDIECTENTIEIIKLFKENRHEQLLDFVLTSDNKAPTIGTIYLSAMSTAILNDDVLDKYNESLLKNLINDIKNIILSNDTQIFKDSISNVQLAIRQFKWFNYELSLKELCDLYSGILDVNILRRCQSSDDIMIYSEILFEKDKPVFPESLLNFNDATYSDVIDCYNEKISAPYYITKSYLLYVIALKNSDYDYAKRILCDILTLYEPAIFRFNTSFLKKQLETRIILGHDIDIYDLILTFIITDLSNYRETMFKNFMDISNIKSPLEIIDDCDIAENLKHYFLGEICTIPTLSLLYLLFESANDSENYRIDICKYLTSVDCINSSKYSFEISQILKEQEIRSLKKTVDSSKLSIDTNGIKEKVYSDIRGLVNKYNATFDNEYDFVDYACPYAQITDSNTFKMMAPKKYIIIDDIFKKYATEFCFGNSGLDTYLSTRVRHGTFQNTITRIVKSNSLYSIDNNFFKSIIEKKLIKSEIHSVIDDFREKLVFLLQYLTSNTFKVYIDNYIDGAVFDYNISIYDLAFIIEELDKYHSEIDTNQILGIVSEAIMLKTNSYLENIRNIILEQLNKDLICLLQELNNNIKNICINEHIAVTISDRISKCGTDLQNEINEIKNWFYLSKSVPMDPFNWEQLFNVLTKTLSQQFEGVDKINLNKCYDINTTLNGNTFVYFYDALLIILTNAIQHSKFDKYEDLKLDCSIIETEYELKFVIKNNISDKANINDIDESISKTNRIYNDKTFLQLNSRLEGGMGLIKIMDMFNNIMTEQGFSVSREKDSFIIQLNILKGEIVCD